jgi:TetR/AcrR family fatty acid metabolism transcriptional regulator
MKRRERLKQEKEARILDAAAAVFSGKGYHGATIRDIAARADVADGTIYNYFDNKFDLLVAILTRVSQSEQLGAELTQALDQDARDFFVAAFRDRLARIEAGEEMLKAVLPQVFVNEELRRQFYQQYVRRIAGLLEPYVQAQVDRGRIAPVNVPLVTRLVQSAFVGLLVMRILGDEALRAGWDDVPELMATMVFDGLAAAAGAPGAQEAAPARATVEG